LQQCANLGEQGSTEVASLKQVKEVEQCPGIGYPLLAQIKATEVAEYGNIVERLLTGFVRRAPRHFTWDLFGVSLEFLNCRQLGILIVIFPFSGDQVLLNIAVIDPMGQTNDYVLIRNKRRFWVAKSKLDLDAPVEVVDSGCDSLRNDAILPKQIISRTSQIVLNQSMKAPSFISYFRSGTFVCYLGLFLLPAASAIADVVVIANPKSGAEMLSHDEVVNIFLGRFRQLPSGLSALPADLPPAQPEKAVFYRMLVNKELAEINSYWARLIFSGRTVPPKRVVSDDDMLNWVANTRGGIGYIDRSKLDGRTRIVYEFVP